ncbi:hypothetical protein ACQEU5_06605 [Marinactinospora thermotolerans]|uniref:hypothetical protein n=1 Tax=Marinactinospora thermotolerans TaxID=531310 RepID=UPI003D92A71C
MGPVQRQGGALATCQAGAMYGAVLGGKDRDMFFFFSNRLGCLGSIAVSVALTALLVLLLYSCR